MRWLWLVFVLLLGCAEAPPPTLPKIEPGLAPTSLASLAELTTAGLFSVEAYVMRLPGCPPCEGPAPCEPCGPSFVDLSDQPNVPPLPADSDTHVDPVGRDLRAFKTGTRYRFILEVQLLPDRPEPYIMLRGAEVVAAKRKP